MDYKILSFDVQSDTHQFLVDKLADVDNLPKETGSVALVANTGDIYVCNNEKEWKKL